VALLGDRLLAAVRFTPITIGGADGALLLGPLAVDPDFTGQGFGRRLISEAMGTAKAAGVKLVVLVGDEPYYGRFGFAPVPPGQITLPGPVDPQRLLAAELQPGALPGFNGLIAAQR
jgi:predicted N-acetyltransferase YhbS